MVKLADVDIQTPEVLQWRGVHVLHYPMSSCSQKQRIYLGAKNIAWTPHIIDLSAHESYGAWFMGINPRGMVPVLVVDGTVHIDSNDIMAFLEERYSAPVLWPAGRATEIAALLAREDELHHDLRVLSFRFVHGRTSTTKTPELLATYRSNGTETVAGRPDTKKAEEVRFYETLAAEGLSDALCHAAAWKFRAAFDAFEQGLSGSRYLVGDTLSVIDIAWFVYAHRLDLAGYPLKQLHPRVEAWYRGLSADALWAREVDPGPAVKERLDLIRRKRDLSGITLGAVAGF